MRCDSASDVVRIRDPHRQGGAWEDLVDLIDGQLQVPMHVIVSCLTIMSKQADFGSFTVIVSPMSRNLKLTDILVPMSSSGPVG